MPFTDVPPSYHSSTTQSPLPLVAPYLSSSTLVALCLVSHSFHTTFIPFLWGDPASHFGIANDAVYVALTRFRRVIPRARLFVRELTHTLHLPPALSEIYGGPRPGWLRDVLEGLPNLQSLVVGGLPFFDHGALMALRRQMVPRRDVYGDPLEGDGGVWEEGYGLKLLLASSEPNTTSLGLSHALPRFEHLVYLDLSFTKSAKDAGVLAALGGMGELQALKLQGIGLRDGELEVLANAIGIRVRLLDVRDNALTDMAVRSLMQACFLGVKREAGPVAGVDRLNTRRVEDWPVGMQPGPDFFSLDTLRSEDLDRELMKQLTNPLTGRLAFEDIPQGGLTHLYISGNRLSVEGLASLLKSTRLHLLDGGSVDTVKTISRTQSLSTASGYVDEVKFPGAEKLVPILAESASKNLTYLRVDHAVLTAQFEPHIPLEKKTSISSRRKISLDEPVSPVTAEMGGDEHHVAELPAAATYAVELPSDNHPIYELDATPMQPRAELPGDMIYFAVSPPIGQKPEENQIHPEPKQKEPIRGEGAFAPEVDLGGTYHGMAPPVLENGTATMVNGAVDSPHTNDVSDEGSTNSTGRSILSPVSPMTPHGTHFQPLIAPATQPKRNNTTKPTQSTRPPVQQESAPTPPPRPVSPMPTPTSIRQARIEYLHSLRPPPENFKTMSHPLSLHPSHLPNLRTLVLTSVPLTVPASSPLISRLKAFISACAIESVLSHLLAATDYSLPPGRARHMAEKAAAKRLFALQTIVLEMAQPAAVSSSNHHHHANKTGSDPRAWTHSRQRISMSKSSTGDVDSENLWSAAADDFSFFAEEGGEEEDECGIYNHEKDKYFPSAAVWDDKILLSPDDAESAIGRDSPVTVGSATLSPVHALGRGNTVSGGGGGGGTWRSPRELPMGRNRRLSNESRRSPRNSFSGSQPQRPSHTPVHFTAELPGSTTGSNSGAMPRSSLPSSLSQRRQAPTSHPINTLSANANVLNGGGGQDISPPISPLEDEPQLDVVSHLGAWRKERKAAYEAELLKFRRFKAGLRPEDAEGLIEPFVEGMWQGKIEVVRNARPKGRSGLVDFYGNFFVNSYLYA